MNTVSGIEGQAPVQGRSIHGGKLAGILITLMLTLLLEALDQTIVSTAAPKIIGSLQGLDRYTWLITAYLLASIAVMPIAGKLSDQFGRKWFFISGVSVFLIGSLFCSLAQDMNQLIIFRVIQGLGAGIGITLVFTAVGDIFPPAERPRWQGIFASVYGFASIVGPLLGGWLSDQGPLLGNIVTETTRWRWIFLINIPLGVIALVALIVYYPLSQVSRSGAVQTRSAWSRIDWLGASLVTIATVSLLLSLTWGGNQIYAWTSVQVILCLVVALILYVAFFFAERSATEPILSLHLFKNQIFVADSILALILGIVQLALVIYLPLFLQGALGISATNSGALITPLTLSFVVGSTIAGISIARLGRYQRIAMLGFLLASIGALLFTFLNTATSIVVISIDMVVAGIGIGMFTPIPNLVIQNGLPRSLMGASTGAITYVRSLGQVLGPTIVGTIISHALGANAIHLNQTQQLIGAVPKVVLAGAIAQGFWAVFIFSLIGLASTFFLKDKPLSQKFAEG